MSRLKELRRFADKTSLGIEIAPYFNPTVSKANGYNVLVLDVFDTEILHENARNDPNIAEERIQYIEEVDIVSDASRLLDVVREKGLSGKVKYILSSHNFEHLPDPISFLQGCSSALEPGGVLSMAIPDYRACFDHFRMPTKLSDWLGAYHRGYSQPSPETLFDASANNASYMRGDTPTVGMDFAHETPDGFRPSQNLRARYADYITEVEAPSSYKDAHCNVVFGASFELLLCDLRHLGLIDLEVIEIGPTKGLEFIVHLRKPAENGAVAQSDDAFYARRLEHMREVNASLGTAGLRNASGVAWSGGRSAKRMVRGTLGDNLFQKLSAINARRLEKRRNKG